MSVLPAWILELGYLNGWMALCPPQSTAKDEIAVSKLYRLESY